jgi:hypothetical protein
VQERLDGSVAVCYQGCCLATIPAPPEAPVLRARNTTRLVPNMIGSSNELVVSTQKAPRLKSAQRFKPGPDHPWRRSLKVHIDRGWQIHWTFMVTFSLDNNSSRDWLCWCSMILSPVNCSEKMSPYEREGDIEQKGTEEIDGVSSRLPTCAARGGKQFIRGRL